MRPRDATFELHSSEGDNLSFSDTFIDLARVICNKCNSSDTPSRVQQQRTVYLSFRKVDHLTLLSDDSKTCNVYFFDSFQSIKHL